MTKGYSIHKAAGILIKNKKLLVEKSYGKDFYISPGGSIEEGESSKLALKRELMEEFSIETNIVDFEKFGTFYAKAAGKEEVHIRIDVFVVKNWVGDPTPTSEVEKLAWITSNYGDMPVGSIFAKDVIPRLKSAQLID